MHLIKQLQKMKSMRQQKSPQLLLWNMVSDWVDNSESTWTIGTKCWLLSLPCHLSIFTHILEPSVHRLVGFSYIPLQLLSLLENWREREPKRHVLFCFLFFFKAPRLPLADLYFWWLTLVDRWSCEKWSKVKKEKKKKGSSLTSWRYILQKHW